MLSGFFSLIYPLLAGIIYTGIGGFSLAKDPVYINIIIILAAASLPLSGLYCIIISIKNKVPVRAVTVIQTLFEVSIAFLIASVPIISLTTFMVVFEIYLTFYFAVKLSDMIIFAKNGDKKYFVSSLVQAASCYMLFFGIIFLPESTKYELLRFGSATIVFAIGIAHICEFLSVVIPSQKIKRKLSSIKLTLPDILGIGTLHRLSAAISDHDHTSATNAPNVEILFHCGSKGIGVVGHCDLCINGHTYTYGNYDTPSQRLFNLMGNGIIAVAERNSYINWNILKNNKTIISFGLHLSENDLAGVQSELTKLSSGFVPWHSHLKGKKEFAANLLECIDADFYKINEGHYKTYFTPTINCVSIVCSMLANTSLGRVYFPGIKTPGSYMFMLQRLHDSGSNVVVSQHIYTHKKLA